MRDDADRDEFDDVIDEAARALTAGAPPASLRADVLQRIRPHRRASFPAWRVAAVAAPLALLAIVIAGKVWLTGTPAHLMPAADVAAAPERGAFRPTPDPVPPRDKTAESPTRETAALTPALPPAEALVVTPITLELIEEPIESQPIAIQSLAAPMPLALEPIVVEPLTLE